MTEFDVKAMAEKVTSEILFGRGKVIKAADVPEDGMFMVTFRQISAPVERALMYAAKQAEPIDKTAASDAEVIQ